MPNDVKGQWPDFSSLSDDERRNIPAAHTLTEDEIGKIAVMDHEFYEGHVGFYRPEEVEDAKAKAKAMVEKIDAYARARGWPTWEQKCNMTSEEYCAAIEKANKNPLYTLPGDTGPTGAVGVIGIDITKNTK